MVKKDVFKLITILTPTYNRGNKLNNLFESLNKQTNFNFKWLIIDDGSNDNTNQLVKQFDTKNFKISYYCKQNGGKHTALNFAHRYIEDEWVFIVDSDDVLLEDAIYTAIEKINQYGKNNKIGCIAFQRGVTSGVSLSKNLYKEDYISNAIEYRINLDVKGDQAEIYRTEVLKKYKFPEFEGERFLSESFLHLNAAKEYQTVYVSKVIYLCEYLDGGLTKSGRKLFIENPLGGMLHGTLFLSNRFKLKHRIKGMMLYICYGMFARKSFATLFNNSVHKFLFIKMLPFSVLLYVYWRIRFKTY